MVSSQSILSLKDESLHAVLNQLRSSMIVSRTIGIKNNSDLLLSSYNVLPLNPVSSTLFRDKSDTELSAIIDFLGHRVLSFTDKDIKVIVNQFCIHPKISAPTLHKLNHIFCDGERNYGFKQFDREALNQKLSCLPNDDLKQMIRFELLTGKSNSLNNSFFNDANLMALLSIEALSESQAEMALDYCIEMKTPQSLMLYKKAFQDGVIHPGYIEKTIFERSKEHIKASDLPLSVFIKICLSECTNHDKDQIFDLIVNNRFDYYQFKPSVYSAKDLSEDHLNAIMCHVISDETYKNYHKEQFGHQSLNSLRYDISARLLNEHYYPKILTGQTLSPEMLILPLLHSRTVTVFDIDVWSKYGIRNMMEIGGKKFNQFLCDKVYSGPLCEYFTTMLLKERTLTNGDTGYNALSALKKNSGTIK